MNIFILSTDPQKAAVFHNDKHLVKMILESAQLLCTAHRVLDVNPHPDLYRATHINHPCSKWVRETDCNYNWLNMLFVHLCDEYTFRYDKVHLSYTKLHRLLCFPPDNIPRGPLTQFAQAMPDKYKNSDVVTAYRNYYLSEKRSFSKWTKRNTPDWFV